MCLFCRDLTYRLCVLLETISCERKPMPSLFELVRWEAQMGVN